jgi:hypothetical protein
MLQIAVNIRARRATVVMRPQRLGRVTPIARSVLAKPVSARKTGDE